MPTTEPVATTESSEGEVTDIEAQAIESAVERDKFFGADEAKAFGLVDEVFDKRPAPGEGDTTHQSEAA